MFTSLKREDPSQELIKYGKVYVTYPRKVGLSRVVSMSGAMELRMFCNIEGSQVVDFGTSIWNIWSGKREDKVI